jgi:hypothetical protein
MTFELRVEFAGLCLYMIDPKKKKVAIVMPDARKDAEPEHEDGEDGDAHVGYIRFDLANLDVPGMTGVTPGKPDDGSGRPLNEVVHHFAGQELDFGLGKDSLDSIDIGVPNFDKFADLLKPVDKMFDPVPPNDLLMRTTLSGGTIEAHGLGKTWAFSPALHSTAGDNVYSNQFAGFALWTRTVDDDHLTITISNFNGGPEVRIPLKPVDIDGKNIIAIKVANLCAHNPLEWREFPLRTVVKHDLDFKWLYRLLTPKTGMGNYKKVLAGAELPFPRAIPNQAFGDEDCMGGCITTPL